MSLVKVNNKQYIQTEGITSVTDIGYRTTFGWKYKVAIECFNGATQTVEDVTVNEIIELIEEKNK